MPVRQIAVPVYLPQWLHRSLRQAKRRLFPAPTDGLDITGERQPEWAFISAHMPSGPGDALDFGCEHGYLSLLAAVKGFHVTGLDLQHQEFPWRHPNFQFLQGDLLELALPKNHFDLIINCSSVEHVGLAGRYGQTANHSDGDVEAMQRILAILKPPGMLLMTAPCGRDAVFPPFHRVYGPNRLPRLLQGFRVEKEVFWQKDRENRWAACDKEAALRLEPWGDKSNAHRCLYALGGFVLRKPVGA